jgi:hypothetical protein
MHCLQRLLLQLTPSVYTNDLQRISSTKKLLTLTIGLALLLLTFAALSTREYWTEPLAGTQRLQLAIFVRM